MAVLTRRTQVAAKLPRGMKKWHEYTLPSGETLARGEVFKVKGVRGRFTFMYAMKGKGGIWITGYQDQYRSFFPDRVVKVKPTKDELARAAFAAEQRSEAAKKAAETRAKRAAAEAGVEYAPAERVEAKAEVTDEEKAARRREAARKAVETRRARAAAAAAAA